MIKVYHLPGSEFPFHLVEKLYFSDALQPKPVRLMKSLLLKALRCLFVFSVLNQAAKAQIYINELDSDTPGIDTKEFVEIRTMIPFTSLNGYVLVFFNGNPTASNANESYYAISLNGLVTDANGLVVIGNNAVTPVPALLFSDNVIQNGEDAVAIYQGNLGDFPAGTLATTTNLVHALAYDTSDPDAVALMSLLGIVLPQVQMNENENNLSATESIQRKNDGSFEVKAPTPGAMNDGSGIAFNGVTIYANTAHHTEGDTLHITFKTQTPVATALNFSFSLQNGTFTTADYTGSLNISIPVGGDSAMTIISTVDDTADEGDEVLKIAFGTLPTGFVRMNDNVQIRIEDNDYLVDPWGTPLQPTFGIVSPTIPAGYYSPLNGLSGAALKQAMQNIIADSNLVRAHCYGDIPDILKQADHNPKNNNQVWLMYVETPRAKLDYQTTASGTGKWNREHIYPQSRGGFSNGTSDTADGINVYLPTNANDILAGHADAHSLRAEDATENSSRNNRDYGGSDYNGPVGTAGSWKGDVARALFYMAVRYNGLSLVSGNPNDTTVGQLGDLDTLLAWHQADPPDDFEMYRNNYIQTWQYNRNPFIDRPELANYIYGNLQGQVYFNNTSVPDITVDGLRIYPNPAQRELYFEGLAEQALVSVYSITGVELIQTKVLPGQALSLNLTAGCYILRVKEKGVSHTAKLLVNP